MRKSLFFPVVTALAVTSFVQGAHAQNTSPYWSLAGNNNATTASKLGTTNGVGLRFFTNNAQRMTISHSSGYVGIGVLTPTQKLEVNGNINITKGYRLHMENRPVLRVDSMLNSVFLGNGAGAKNEGYYNTAVGYYAFANGSLGNNNTAMGFYSPRYNTTGNSNVASGTTSLQLNTTGSDNTATGHAALSDNTTGNHNTAIGRSTLFYNNTGNQNTAVGSGALNSVNNANANTAVGFYAGSTYQHGWNNTFIGADANAAWNGIYNSVAIGNAARVYAPSQVRIGNTSTISIGGYTTWTNVSDGRVKKNIQENVPGLAFINKLKPVTYNLDLDAADKITGRVETKDKDGKLLPRQAAPEEVAARQAKQQIVYTGFVAQGVEKAAKELNYNFSGVDAAKNEKDLYGLRYTEFVMPLVKAVQELSNKDEELQQKTAEIDALKNDVAELRRMVQSLTKGTIREVSSPAGTLGQNTPNPATGSTRISYTLPKTKDQAQLLLTDAAGKAIKTIALQGSGTLVLDTTAFSTGIYTYSLLIDGKIKDTKKLTIAR